jgi:hypothetical protein
MMAGRYVWVGLSRRHSDYGSGSGKGDHDSDDDDDPKMQESSIQESRKTPGWMDGRRAGLTG